MDAQLLRDKGIQPADIRLASVPGFDLRIGARATLVPAPRGEVHGVLMKLSHADLDSLYADPGVAAYRPEPVLALLENETPVAALCYNLPEAPSSDEHDAGYASRLRSLAEAVGLPAKYVASIR